MIFHFLTKKSPKCTYDIVRLVTVATIIIKLIIGWIAGAIVNLGNPKVETAKVLVILTYYNTSQMVNAVTLFNVYAFVFEYRTPKIDPNLPHWITCTLGTLLPFLITAFTHVLDHSVILSYEPDFVEHAIGVKGER